MARTINISRILMISWLCVFLLLMGILYARVLITQHSDVVISKLVDLRISLEVKKIELLERELNVRAKLLRSMIVINTVNGLRAQRNSL